MTNGARHWNGMTSPRFVSMPSPACLPVLVLGLLLMANDGDDKTLCIVQ